MKKQWLHTTLFILCACALTGCKSEQPKAASADTKLSKDDILIKDEADDTDIYAIPLDSSEAEENQELRTLEQESKKPKK